MNNGMAPEGLWQFVFGVLTKLIGVSLSIVTIVGCLLLAVARTVEGRIFAGVVLPLSLLGLIAVYRLARRDCLPRPVLSIPLLSISLLCLGLGAARVPSGSTPPEARLRSIYVGEARIPRLSPARLVPESDQARLGSYLLPLIDPVMGFGQAARFRRLYGAVYEEIAASPGMADAGSVVGEAYADMLFNVRRLEHLYVYYPKAADVGPRPAIVFLHGWLGNFEVYAWKWRTFAEAHDVAIVCPTFGAGYWNRAGALETIERSIDFCSRDPRIDEDSLYLAGISNGGVGVTRAMLHFSESFDGLIYISPVMGVRLMHSDAFAQRTAGKPILVVHGAADRRIPADYVAEATELMRERGLEVERKSYEGEEHLLMLSAFDQLSADVAEWMVRDS